jgi:chromate reductase
MSEIVVPRPLRVLGFAGSLRRASYNRALLRAAVELAPTGMAIEIHDLASLPLYNGDVEAEGIPQPVAALRTALARADGLLIVTPEHNHGLPAVTKNAIEWLSRPPKPHPLDGRPTAILGASPGPFGTARSQSQLRLVLASTNTLVLAQPQYLLAGAEEKFDAELRLADAKSRERLTAFLRAFAAWIERLRGG